MDKKIASLDWSLVQGFLAVAETGSLSAAARKLGTSQPTLGRRVRAAEAALGAELFRRHPKGLALTETGKAILPAAQTMREAAGRIALVAAGQDRALEGTVRITASVAMAHFVLPPILAGLRRDEPGIQLDLVASDSSENLMFREADIAIRMYRPKQQDMVARHLGDIPLGIYAARSYLDRAGRPQSLEDLRGHDWIGFDREERMIREMRHLLGWPVERDFFAARTDDQAANWQLVRAGLGIGIGQIPAATADPLVERLLPEIRLPHLPVWLAAHETVRRVPRVARVWRALVEGLTAAIS